MFVGEEMLPFVVPLAADVVGQHATLAASRQSPDATAPAPTDPDPPPVDEPPAREWYGWQTLLVDAGAITAMGIAAHANGNAGTVAGWSSVIGYALGSPIVHGFHGRPLVGLGDAGMRVALPLVAALIGIAIGEASCPPSTSNFLFPNSAFCGLDGMAVGAVVGAGAASALDAVFLAWERPKRSASVDGVTWLPAVAVERGGAVAGVGGRF